MIKPLDLTDDAVVDELFTVQRLAYAVEAELIGFDRIPGLVETRDELQATHERFLGYYDDEGLAGAISFTATESEVDICRMMVHPRAFRQGIASKLLDALEPAPRTIVSTGSNNEPALRLYRKHGFAETGRTEVAPGVWTTQLQR